MEITHLKDFLGQNIFHYEQISTVRICLLILFGRIMKFILIHD